jgi:hypothetical protein
MDDKIRDKSSGPTPALAIVPALFSGRTLGTWIVPAR